jgi:LysM repeat protein
MNIDPQEPPLRNPDQKPKAQGAAQKLGLFLNPAISGFARFGRQLVTSLPKIEKSLKKTSVSLEKYYFQFARNYGLNKSFGYQLGLLVVFVLISWISAASINQQNHIESVQYTKTIDPIEAGQFVRYLSPYTPKEFYIDPDNVALAQMQKSDSFTLAQQLSVNADSTVQEPQRAAPTYTLQSGETITQVAQKFGLHVGTLLDANNIQPTDLKKVKPGTILIIPSSDTNTSTDWLVAINKADADARAQAAATAATAAAKKAQTARVATRGTGLFSYAQGGGGSYSSDITVIGYSNEQCLPWAREQTGIQVHGYAGAVAPTQSSPKVGGLALDRFYGHISVIVGVGDGYIIVHEANWIPGRIDERKVSTSAIRGYVY